MFNFIKMLPLRQSEHNIINAFGDMTEAKTVLHSCKTKICQYMSSTHTHRLHTPTVTAALASYNLLLKNCNETQLNEEI